MIIRDVTNSVDVILPDGLHWVDEFSWSPVQQDTQYTIGGTFVVQENVVKAGRPIQLAGGADVWATRSSITKLKELIDKVDIELAVILPDGREFNVKFDRTAGAFSATPLWRVDVQQPDYYYNDITINLIEMESIA